MNRYSSKVFAWLAAGALGLGATTAIANDEADHGHEKDHEKTAQQEAQSEQGQDALQPFGIPADEQRSQQQSQKQSQKQGQQGQQAQSKQIRGTVVDLEAYLIHGNDKQKLSQQDLDPQDSVAVLTEQGELYLLIDRYEDVQRSAQAGQQMQKPDRVVLEAEGGASAVYGIEGQSQQQQDAQQKSQSQQRSQQQQSESSWHRDKQQSRSDAEGKDEATQLGGGLADPAGIEPEDTPTEADASASAELDAERKSDRMSDAGAEAEIEVDAEADREAEQQFGVPADDRARRSDRSAQSSATGQEDRERHRQAQADRQRHASSQQDAGSDKPLELKAGQQVTLTGKVYEQGSFKGIVVSGYTIQGQSSQQFGIPADRQDRQSEQIELEAETGSMTTEPAVEEQGRTTGGQADEAESDGLFEDEQNKEQQDDGLFDDHDNEQSDHEMGVEVETGTETETE